MMTLKEETLDPKDWEKLRALAHKMIDDSIDHLKSIRKQPVWQKMPDGVEQVFKSSLPKEPTKIEKVYEGFMENALPYPMGNVHPRFWMWYMGSSSFTGAMGDFLAAIIGSNLGGGNHSAALIDIQVVDWCKEMMGFPADSSGTLVSGGTMANMVGLTVARNEMAGIDVRAEGVEGIDQPLRFYSSDQVHSCHQKSMEILGLGKKGLTKIKSNEDFTMDMEAIKMVVHEDRIKGLKPVCIIANAGAVNTGAVDDLNLIADFCESEGLWLHVDGCIGALLNIAPEGRKLVNGISRADSIALDPHKWLHAPFDVGCALIKDAKAHFNTFALRPEYLQQAERGIASANWLHEYGYQTSRGFRALKVWMTIKEHGINKFGRLIDQNINQAKYLTKLISESNHLQLMSPTFINIVCFKFIAENIRGEENFKSINTEIMLRLQEAGTAAISDTTLNGEHCLRVAITNHRTIQSDLDLLISEIVRIGMILI